MYGIIIIIVSLATICLLETMRAEKYKARAKRYKDEYEKAFKAFGELRKLHEKAMNPNKVDNYVDD